jgi:hypothetical protein
MPDLIRHDKSVFSVKLPARYTNGQTGLTRQPPSVSIPIPRRTDERFFLSSSQLPFKFCGFFPIPMIVGVTAVGTYLPSPVQLSGLAETISGPLLSQRPPAKLGGLDFPAVISGGRQKHAGALDVAVVIRLRRI